MGIWLDEGERKRLMRAVLDVWTEPHAPRNLVWLGEGFGSAAFETPDGLIVLVAKNAVGAHSRRVTAALTPILAPALPIAVPVPAWSIEKAFGIPYGAYAYEKLPGRMPTLSESARAPEAVSAKIGAFLSQLHAFPLDRAREIGLPDFDEFWQDIASIRPATVAVLRSRLSANDYARVEAWWDGFLADDALTQAPRCLVHGDLWRHNLLVDEAGQDLLGIIDFGDVGIVDAAYDFAPLQEAGSALFNGALEAYRRLGGTLDARFEHRVQRWWELRCGSWFSLRAAIRSNDEAEIADALHELRQSPVLADA